MLLIVPRYKLWFMEPPLGALYICAKVRSIGHPVEFIDLNIERDEKVLFDLIRKHKKIGISANVAHAASGLKIAKQIKTEYPDKQIIWGGPYPSVQYKDLIPEYADIVIIGEGEEQISQLLNNVDPEKIDGIAFTKNEKILVNRKFSYIENLDELPFPAWDMIPDIRKYRSPGKKPNFSMITQRGCPYQCINCTKFIHGDTYRTRSVHNVLEEIQYLADTFGCREIHIWDDNFTLIPSRVKEICVGIVERGLNRIRFALPNGIRGDICDEEMFKMMRQAGFFYVNVAVESGEQEVVDKLGKRLDLDKVPRTVEILNKLGFRIGLFFIIGLPFETEESLKKTVRFAASLPAHHAHFFRCTPFPGTKLFEMIHNKEVLNKTYKSKEISYDKNDVPAFHLSEKILNYYHHLAYRKFYLTPSRIPRIIMKLVEEGTFVNDMYFVLENGVKIIFRGNR